MQFVTSRSDALDKLNKYIENDISNYNSKRNFDFGVNNRSNVSCLSPYITHRLINEYETAKLVLKKYPCLLYTSPSPRDISGSRMPSSA